MSLYRHGYDFNGTLPQAPREGLPSAAALLLGITLPTDRETVLRAYRGAVRNNHPDTAGTDAKGLSMGDLQKARDVLLAAINYVPENQASAETKTCFMCGGSGRLPSGFGSTTCPACDGNGVSR